MPPKNKWFFILIMTLWPFLIAKADQDNNILKGKSAEIILDTKLAIAVADVSAITPVYPGTRVILPGYIDDYGTFRQRLFNKAFFNFTPSKRDNANNGWFKNLKQEQPDKEWFQDVRIVFQKPFQDNDYYVSIIDSDKSSVTICDNPSQPVCLKFKPFGQSLQPIQSLNDITYFIMDPVVGESRPSIMFQFKLKTK